MIDDNMQFVGNLSRGTVEPFSVTISGVHVKLAQWPKGNNMDMI